jgi:drug/metabolite transporter (DMT)-like permease
MAAVWMLFASFAFAAMGAGVKLASSFYSTSEIVMYRGIIGCLLLLPMIRLRGGMLRTPFPKEHLWRSIVGVVSLWMWFYAIAHLPLATAVTLNYMSPIWLSAYMFAHGWWQRKGQTEWPLLLAVAASFIGVVLVLRPAADTHQFLGGAVAIGSSVIAAMAYMQVRRLGQMGEPEYRVVFYFSLTMALAGLLGTPFENGVATPLHAHTWHSAALLVAVGIPALMAQMAMTRAYRVGKVLVVANLQYTGIIFSSLWGMVLWGDVFDWHVWLGMAVILASGSAATFYNTRSNPKRGAADGAVVTDTDPIASE